MSTQVAAAIAGALPASSPDDPSIWKIRTLRADAEIDLDLDDHALARVWAGAIAGSIAAALCQESPDILRFASPRHFLAAYLSDAASGDTGRWYYKEFEGLELLSSSAKIRTALFNSSDGVDALGLLSIRARNALAQRVTEADARAIVAWLAADAAGAGAIAVLARLLETWRELGEPNPERDAEHKWALRLLLEIAASSGAFALPPAAWVAPSVARLLSIASRSSLAARRRLAELVAAGDLRTLVELHGTDSADRLHRLQKLDVGPWLSGGASHSSTGSEPDRLSTLFGGAMLLLPLIAEAQCTDPAGEPALFRLWLLARSLGGSRAESVWRDPLLRDLCAVGAAEDKTASWLGALSQEEVAAAHALAFERIGRPNAGLPKTPEDDLYLRMPPELRSSPGVESAAAELAALILRFLAWKLPGFSASSFGHLQANFLDFTASLEETGQRRIVRVGHPPLGLILNLTGLSHQTYTLGWLDDKPFELFPEG